MDVYSPPMVTIIERASRVALDLLFPPECALCRRGGSLLCERCVQLLPVADGQRCERCFVPIAHDALCAHCLAEAPSFESVRSAFVLEQGAGDLVHQLKYRGMSSLAAPMAGLLHDCMLTTRSADLVVPVPLHPGRDRSRGYNQSLLLARHIARERSLVLDEKALRRIRATKSLVKSMGREERRRIVDGAFAANAAGVEGRDVLLVDDVVTTGATLDACARALLESGASRVRCITFARAD